jgi:hypothetical protein
LCIRVGTVCTGWLRGRTDGNNDDHRNHHYDDWPSRSSAGHPGGLRGRASSGSSGRGEDRLARAGIRLDRRVLALDGVELRLDARSLGHTSTNERCMGRRSLVETARRLGVGCGSLALGLDRGDFFRL